MPQLTNIVLKDGASTPVSHTYNPNGISGTVATLVERAASGVPLGLPTLTLSSTTTSQGRSKVKAVLSRPIVQTQIVNASRRELSYGPLTRPSSSPSIRRLSCRNAKIKRLSSRVCLTMRRSPTW